MANVFIKKGLKLLKIYILKIVQLICNLKVIYKLSFKINCILKRHIKKSFGFLFRALDFLGVSF